MPSLFTAATLITYVVDGCRSGMTSIVPELLLLYTTLLFCIIAYLVMIPFWWMHGTGCHSTVMLNVILLAMFMPSGGADGAEYLNKV